MRSRFMHLASLVAALAAMTLASSIVLAQSSGPGAGKVSGNATASGSLKRTIIDVAPNSPQAIWGTMSVTSVDVNVPFTSGQSADTIGVHLLNAAIAALPGGPTGYSSSFTTPGGVQTRSRPKITRQVGGFMSTESVTPPTGTGITFANDPYTVLDAPAISPVGLGFLAGALPALAFWRRRRKSM